MIRILTEEDAKALMNEYGERGIPFFFAFDFEMQRPFVLRLEEIDPEHLLFDLRGFRNFDLPPKSFKKINFQKYPASYQQYEKAFHHIQQEIHNGNSYLLNLTFPTCIETNLSIKEIFSKSDASYKLWLKDQFVVFSPESFIKIQGGVISTFPMKGTIEAHHQNARRKLLENSKEKAEHATIVDLMRNDLNMVAERVKVEQYRYVEKVRTSSNDLLQTSSKITGWLGRNYQSGVGDILTCLLPAGSVSGAPKKKTVEIIQKAEQYERGYYTGVFGVFDGENLDSAVSIRFIEQQNDKLIFKSGGGITSFSKLEEEYDELNQKVYLPFKIPAQMPLS